MSGDVFSSKRSPLLVFAVAGRIGSGATFVKDGLAGELRAFGYTPIDLDITELFLEKDYPGHLRPEKPDVECRDLTSLSALSVTSSVSGGEVQ
jgi:hypothetical protein